MIIGSLSDIELLFEDGKRLANGLSFLLEVAAIEYEEGRGEEDGGKEEEKGCSENSVNT